MIILALDIASNTGWAKWDTDKHESSIECGAFNVSISRSGRNSKPLQHEARTYAREQMRHKLQLGFEKTKPDVVVIERPLDTIMNNRGPKRTPLFKGEQPQEEQFGGGANSNTVIMLNQLFGVADALARQHCQNVFEVAPKSWQVLTKSFHGKDTKERSIAFCEALKIQFTKMNKADMKDAADAAVIAFWAKQHCQQVKMLERAA